MRWRAQPVRRRSARALAVACLFVSIILASCSKDDESINGIYVYDQRTPDGDGGITLVLSGHDMAVLKIHPPGADPLLDTEGTYHVEGETLIVTLNNAAHRYTIRNSHRLEGEFLGERIVLKKK